MFHVGSKPPGHDRGQGPWLDLGGWPWMSPYCHSRPGHPQLGSHLHMATYGQMLQTLLRLGTRCHAYPTLKNHFISQQARFSKPHLLVKGLLQGKHG